jgi:hypothetical protein
VESNDSSRSKAAEVISNLVRFRFREDCKIRSPTQIVNGLKAGYAALDLIHACNHNSSTASSQLKTLIESTASRAEQTTTYRAALAAALSPTSPRKLNKIAHLRAVATKANSTRYPGSKPVLQRPLPLSEIKGGKRRVPNLISAQGVPFLRYSKPQPISLSRVIGQKQQRDQKKWTQREDLTADTIIAQWEDKWDEVVQAQMAKEQGRAQSNPKLAETLEGLREANGQEQSWKYEIVSAERELYWQIKENDRRNADLGRAMWEIVVKERELAAQEKREAKIQRRIERKAAAAAAIEPPALQTTG